MKHEFGKTVVIALGGSIMYPDGIDVDFLKSFREFILEQIRRHGRRFIIVVGGGAPARVYQEAAAAVVSVADEDKDWLGIHATRSNAHLVRTIFREEADPVVVDSRGKIESLEYPVTIASGWRPGNSTDFVAMALACDLGAMEVVILGRPEYVYNKDPREDDGAKPYDALGWEEYKKLVPQEWVPGASAPVDPIAAQLGEEKGITTIVAGGKDLDNVRNLLEGEKFQGTVIS